MLFFAQNIAQDSIIFNSKDSITTFEPKNFEPNFKEKYQDKAFEYEPKIEVNSTWEQFKSWLKNLLSKIFGLGNKAEGFADILIRIGSFLLIIVVIYFVTKAILNKEGQWIFGKSSKNIFTDENIEKNIHKIDFQTLIQEKINQKDYRLAIRYYYLFLLKKMSDQKMIDWELNKTNADYAYEIKDVNQKVQFEKLSYLYDYIWYGEFEIEESQYLQTIQEFKQVIQKL